MSRTLSRLALALLVAIVAACSPDASPTSPSSAAQPQPALVGDLLGTTTDLVGTTTKVLGGVVGGLLPCNVTQSYSTSQVVGPDGGLVRVGPHSLFIPRGALGQNVTIVATAPSGNAVKVDFQPHGLVFARPTSLTMSYKACGLTGFLRLNIVYVDDSNPELPRILETLPSLTNIFTQTVSAPANHFSLYALAD